MGQDRFVFESAALGEEVRVLTAGSRAPEAFVILLHGFGNRPEDLFERMPLTELAERYRLVIAAPACRDEYYVSRPGRDYAALLSKELPEELAGRFSIPEGAGRFLAGISMGGYGAVLTGAGPGARFDAVLSIGGAFYQNDVAIGNPEVVGRGPGDPRTLLAVSIFGPFSGFGEDGRRNPEAALAALSERGNPPRFLLAWGSDDPLAERNERMRKVFGREGIPVETWICPGGGHDWDCFGQCLSWGLGRIWDECRK